MTLTKKQIKYFKNQLNEVDYSVFSEFISEFEYLNSEIDLLILKIFNTEFLTLIQKSESEIFIKILFLKMFIIKKMIKIDSKYKAFLIKYDRNIISYLTEFEIEFIQEIKEKIQLLNNNR